MMLIIAKEESSRLLTKALIASGFSKSKNVKKVLQLGAGSFIIKPYTIEQLGLAVQEELKKK